MTTKKRERPGTTYHVSLVVREAARWSDSKLRGLVADENDDRLTPRQVRAWLFDQIAEGRDYLPFGAPCKGFDYKKGCPGHRHAVKS